MEEFDGQTEYLVRKFNEGMKKRMYIMSGDKAIFRSLAETFRPEIIKVLVLGFFGDGLNLVNAYFMGEIISFIQDEDAPWQEGAWKVALFSVIAFLQAFLRNHNIF